MIKSKAPAKVYLYFQDNTVEIIEGQDIKQLSLTEISDLYTYNLDYKSESNSSKAFEYKQCRSAILEVSNSKNQYERIKEHCIIKLRIVCADNNEQEVLVPWKSKKKNKEHNKYQKITIDRQNNSISIKIIRK